ncbi:2-oxoacid:acceptor oxidoreductase family protein [Fervidicoccus fontis]|uniref:pyruvate synthase n=1 Tax=Fervidicoccus fontis TaxID=683846 RepID=A0A2J6N3L7_9CREN|nr:2-oxoacid:acceptor oxidoreductase family protein [Fervidicoccus fontis]PMB75932.1 MAG: hypothetical protein C0188_01180 [Fervidicoccus fontis]PMB77421.1 MAG: hypothetical protein C0177_03305 [Fervidicoccus fontis]HEW63911.1 hypothetical protein [Fervidicoccus fontis]
MSKNELIKYPFQEELLNKDIIEVTWLGRGGQGAVTASELVAMSAIKEGKNAIAIPEFGAERRGVPVRAYTRVSKELKEIHKTPIVNPDIFVLLDPSLLSKAKNYIDLKDDGVVIANTQLSKDEAIKVMGIKVKEENFFVIDAKSIVMRILGRPIYNTVMVGAFIAIVPIVKLETVLESVRETFKGKLGDLNAQVIEEGYKHFFKK